METAGSRGCGEAGLEASGRAVTAPRCQPMGGSHSTPMSAHGGALTAPRRRPIGGLSEHPKIGPGGAVTAPRCQPEEGLSQEDKEESSEEGKSDRQVQERAAPCFSLLEKLGTGAGTPTAVCPPSHRDPTTSSVTASAGPASRQAVTRPNDRTRRRLARPARPQAAPTRRTGREGPPCPDGSVCRVPP